jgi:hypothetical protein
MILGKHPIKDPNNIHNMNTQQMAHRMEQLSSELKEDMNRTQPIPSEQANIS